MLFLVLVFLYIIFAVCKYNTMSPYHDLFGQIIATSHTT